MILLVLDAKHKFSKNSTSPLEKSIISFVLCGKSFDTHRIQDT